MNPLVVALAVGTVGLGLYGVASASGAPIPSGTDDSSAGDDSGDPYNPYPAPISYDNSEANLSAYLATIRLGESGDRYDALVGGGTFGSYASHPAIGQGFEGVGNSHAAGAYQFQPGTWQECAAALGLDDFGPASQDRAALFLIGRRGATQNVQDGEVYAAQPKLVNEWRALADRGVAWVASTFSANGGTIA